MGRWSGMMTDWIPFSRPNWVPLDIARAAREFRDWPNPCTGSTVVRDLQEKLAAMWRVPYDWVLLTSSCTEAVELWSMWCSREWSENVLWSVPIMTWPGSYCSLRPQGNRWWNDLLVSDDPIHCTDSPSHLPRVLVRMYGEYHGTDTLRPYDLIDSAHDVGFIPDLAATDKNAVVYSFAACKQLSAERGGALLSPQCRHPKLRMMAASGCDRRVPHMAHALKCGIQPSQAALVLSQLERYEQDQGVREGLVQWYRDLFRNQPVKVWGRSGHLVTLTFPTATDAQTFALELERKRVRTGRHYQLPRFLPDTAVVNAKEFTSRTITVPCFARWKGKSELGYMQEAVRWAAEQWASLPPVQGE